tara:strand:+ start:9107 stop:10861 length:1755 start_codon:yes stop_codon:yes gene_type:complete
MINLLPLSKLINSIFFFLIIVFKSTISSGAEDIWKKQDTNSDSTDLESQNESQQEIVIQSPIISSEEISKISINIEEQTLNKSEQTIIGLFDPQENEFDINLWSTTDGTEIKNIFKRINKLKLSEFSQDLLFRILFTNAYSPRNNLTSDDFLKIKINWLIKNERFQDLENLLLLNPEAGRVSKAVRYIVDEDLSNGNIKPVCKKIDSLKKNIKNNYLEKVIVYCLIHDNRKEEAQLYLDLLMETGFNDSFFENKINFLLGINESSNQKIKDDNLFNFYLSHITSDNFEYIPDNSTNKYIWRYLSSSNLIKIKNLEDKEVILTYEKAAAQNSFSKEEIFNLYKQILFNVNQLINATEAYKNLSNYEARALIYQKILLSENIEKKLYFTFLLKQLFEKDKLENVYVKELSNILKSINPEEIPDNYAKLVTDTIKQNSSTTGKIKFENDVLHKSKVIKHFLENEDKIKKTQKDFDSVYKKIKRNKKYFISIKDVIVLESLQSDGVVLPKDIDYANLASELTVPKNLVTLAEQKQTGLLMLKIVEIIGEDNIEDLDPETIYFLNNILNKLNLKKIRNSILTQALPVRT